MKRLTRCFVKIMMTTNELTAEWFLKTKWGKIAMISWGERARPGALLVHGYLDSAAVFQPLVALLPDTYYYVGFDFPGHGKSDHVSSSQLVSQAFLVEILREIVDHLQWDNFVCVGHSMGCFVATLYHHLYPGKIRKMININPAFEVSPHATEEGYGTYGDHLWVYENYYDYFYFYNGAPARLLPREQLVEMAVARRHVSREQAQVLLSRSLVLVEKDLYRLSTQPITREMLVALKESFRYTSPSQTPPTLQFHGTKTHLAGGVAQCSTSPRQRDVYIDASQDFLLTHPHKMAPIIEQFLNTKFIAKL